MSTIEATNRDFYEFLWGRVRLVDPVRFNTWPRIRSLVEPTDQRLEVGAGMRPRLPIEGTHFADISPTALSHLEASGGIVREASVLNLPYEDARFDLICALDIIEHVEDDRAAMRELARVAKPGAYCLFSMPLFMACWTPFDDIVGHCRRYEPDALSHLLEAFHFQVEESSAYGMQPKSNRLVRWGMDYLEAHPKRALWYYNRILMPLGLRFQKKLHFTRGWCALSGVDEILLVCRFQEP